MLVNTLTDKTMKIAQYGTMIVRWFCGLTDPAGARSLKSLSEGLGHARQFE